MFRKIRNSKLSTKIVSMTGLIALTISGFLGYQRVDSYFKLESMKRLAVNAAHQYLEDNGVETNQESITVTLGTLAAEGYIDDNDIKSDYIDESYVVTYQNESTAHMVRSAAGSASRIIIGKEEVTATFAKQPEIPTQGNVVVTMTVSEPITTPNGWTPKKVTNTEGELVDSTTVFTKTFSDNGIENISLVPTTIEHSSKTKQLVISNIDRIAPVVEGVTEGAIYGPNTLPTITYSDANTHKDNVVTATLENLTTNETTTISSSTSVSLNGKYTLEVVDTAGNQTTVHFTVDLEAPTITLEEGNQTVIVPAGTTDTAYVLNGVVLSDNVDSTTVLKNNIRVVNKVNTSVVGTYTITYVVTDTAGNTSATVTRNVVVEDNLPPVLTVESPISLQVGDSYDELQGVSAIDLYDGDITSKVNVTYTGIALDITKKGQYYATYKVVDNAGNEATAQRIIIVVDKTALVALKAKVQALKLVETDYTSASWNALQTALNQIENTQTQIDNKITAIQNALDHLGTDLDADLLARLEATKANVDQTATNPKYIESDYTAEAWAAVTDALTKAEAAKNEELNSKLSPALDELDKAIAALDNDSNKASIDYSRLGELLTELAAAEATGDYTETSISKKRTAIQNAYNIKLPSAYATELARIEAMTLTQKELSNKEDLAALETEFGGLTKDDYTPDSYKAVEDAIEAAKKDGLKQSEFEDALEDIRNAIKNLAKYPTITVDADSFTSTNSQQKGYVKADDTITFSFTSDVELNTTSTSVTMNGLLTSYSGAMITPVGKVGENYLYLVSFTVSGTESSALTYNIHPVSVKGAERENSDVKNGSVPFKMDNAKPSITAVENVTIKVGETYTDTLPLVFDVYFGDINPVVPTITLNGVTVSSINTAAPAIYVITYNVTDYAGNAAEAVTRTVNVVSTTALETARTTAGSLTQSDYKADAWTTLQTALTGNVDGKQLTEKTQVEIDAWTTTINNALAALESVENRVSVDTSVVDNFVESKVETDYTNWSDFMSVVASVKSETLQSAFDARVDEVTGYVLNQKPVDKKELTDYLATLGTSSDYTNWSGLQTLIDAANNQTLQSEFDKAVTLVKAYSLTAEGIDTAALDKVEQQIKDLIPTDYENWDDLQALIALAKQQTLQSEFDKIVNNQILGFELMEKAWTWEELDALQAELNEAKKPTVTGESDYTTESIDAKQKLITDAYDLTLYSAYQDALNAIRGTALVYRTIDKTELTNYETLYTEAVNSNKYTEASLEVLKAAIDKAKAQKIPSEYVKDYANVESAYTNLDKYPEVVVGTIRTTNTEQKGYVKADDFIIIPFTSDVELDINKTKLTVKNGSKTYLASTIQPAGENAGRYVYQAFVEVTSNMSGTLTYDIHPVSATGAETTLYDITNGNVGVMADNSKPMIMIPSNTQKITIEVGTVESYEDTDPTVTDILYGEYNSIERKITVNGKEVDKVDPSKAGVYTITYNVKDYAGNAAEAATRVVHVVDKTELKEAIAEANTLEESDYKAEAWANLQDAMSNDLPETTQEEINAKTAGIVAAMEELTKAENKETVDTSALDAIKAQLSTKVESDYTAESWGAIQDQIAVVEAQTLQSKFDAEVAKIDLSTLEAEELDTSALTTIKAQLSTKVESDYTAESWTAIQDQIAVVEAQTLQSKFDAEVSKIDLNDLILIPVIRLNGINPQVIEAGTNYVELGATVTDNDGNETIISASDISEIKLNEEGTYTITYTATDAAGNVAVPVTRTVKVVDQTAPSITKLEVLTKIDQDGWYTQPIKIKVVGTDSGTGIKEYQYKKIVNGVEDTDYVKVPVVDGEAIITLSESSDNVKVKVIAIDNAESANTSDAYESVTYKIDLDSPTVEYKVIKRKDNQPISVNVSTTNGVETSGIKEYQFTYSIDNGDTWSEWTAKQPSTEDGSATFTIDEESEQIIFEVRAKDIAGNIGDSVRSKEAYVYDKTAPAITIVVNGVEKTYTEDGIFEMTVQANNKGAFVSPIAKTEAGKQISPEGSVDLGVLTTSEEPQIITYTAEDAAGNQTVVTGKIYVIDTTKPMITLNGENPQIIEFGNDYQELGATVTDNYDTGLTAIADASKVNVNQLGTYTVTYNVTDTNGNVAEEVTRTVTVVDSAPPLLTITEIKEDGTEEKHVANFEMTVQANSSKDAVFDRLSASAIDNYDETIIPTMVGNVDLSQIGTYTLTYTATDKSSNATVIKVIVNVIDTTVPVITMNGDQEVTVEVNTSYTDAEATAFDNLDGNITANIKTVSTVNINKVGTYTVTYNVTDANGNVAEAKMRIVKVVDTTKPEITLNGANPLQVKYGTTYNELGATVTDNYDTNIDVIISGTIDTYKLGNQTITYKAVDVAGNETTVARTVQVIPVESSESIREANDCDSTGICYSTKSENNYVWYSGYLWRIISIGEDNTMKLITEDSIAGFSYDDDSSQFRGSIVEEWLREEFYTNLNNKSTIVVTAPYCNQAYETATSVRTTCDPNSVVNAKVGLLTLDEYNILGGETGFLNTGDQFFTMTPTGDSRVAHIDYNGIRKTGTVTNTYAIRPVITVSSATRIRAGKGTAADPYRLENDESANLGDALVSRNAGEYVTFAGRNWRIVKTGTVTRLVMDSLYTVGDTVQKPTYSNDKFNLTSGIGQYLNDTVYNAIFSDEEKQAMAPLSLYNASYHPGANPRKTSLVATGTRIEAYVGLNSVGSLLSGNSSSARLKGVTSWLMNYSDITSGYSWYTSTGGTVGSDAITTIRGVKPVIALRNSVTIVSGSGTSTDPYVLSY